MASKTLVLFAIFMVFALFVISEVAAEHPQGRKKMDAGFMDYGRGGNGGPGHGGPGYGPGHGGPGYGGPGYCRWGCCRHGNRGGCSCCRRPDEIPQPMYVPEVLN